MKLVSSYFVLFFVAFNIGPEAWSKDNPFLQSLALYEQVIGTAYAPIELKEKLYSYDLKNEISKVRTEINFGKIASSSQYRQKLIRLTNYLKDHHVTLFAGLTESSTLPFTVISSSKGTYIASIDRKQLPESVFASYVGDEVLEFDGVPIAKVIQNLSLIVGSGDNLSFQRLAQKAVTARYSAEGLAAKQGISTVKVLSNGKILVHQLVWKYIKELMPPKPGVRGNFLELNDLNIERDLVSKLQGTVKESVVERALIKFSNAETDVYSGGYSSFVPNLGPPVWESKKDEFPTFKAYIYLSPDKNLIGYIRISDFFGGTPQLEEMKRLLKHFKNNQVQGLAIDLINNPGGSVPYMYALLTLFAKDEKGMDVLPQRMKVHNASVAQASTLLQIATEFPAQEVLPLLTAIFGGYPFSVADLYNMAEASKKFLNEYVSGAELSTPQYLYGIKTVLPNRDVVFDGPVMLLTNTFGFSCTDFFSAILVDNLRAKSFGERTGGAGGFVDKYKVPNPYWDTLSLTSSVALRLDGSPLEDFGVAPSFPYEIGAADLKGNYSEYKSALVKVMDGLVVDRN